MTCRLKMERQHRPVLFNRLLSKGRPGSAPQGHPLFTQIIGSIIGTTTNSKCQSSQGFLMLASGVLVAGGKISSWTVPKRLTDFSHIQCLKSVKRVCRQTPINVEI